MLRVEENYLPLINLASLNASNPPVLLRSYNRRWITFLLIELKIIAMTISEKLPNLPQNTVIVDSNPHPFDHEATESFIQPSKLHQRLKEPIKICTLRQHFHLV